MLKSSNCFFIKICSQANVSTYWNRKNETTTYWQASLEGWCTQEFYLFLHLILFTGKCVRLLTEKYPDHHILTVDGWMKWCSKVPVVSWFNSFTGNCIHTLKDKVSDHHILTDTVWWLSDEQFLLFLHLILFSGICVHTLVHI